MDGGGGGCRHDSPFAPSPLSYSIGMRCAPSVQSREYIASSPGPSQLFSLAGKKRERAWYLKSRDKRRQKGVVLALPHNVEFTPVWHLWSTKRSSARPLRIVPPSLIVSVAFFFTRIEPERSKIALAHTQFSRSATLRSSYPSIWAYVTHVTLDPRLPLFSRACVLKRSGSLGTRLGNTQVILDAVTKI